MGTARYVDYRSQGKGEGSAQQQWITHTEVSEWLYIHPKSKRDQTLHLHLNCAIADQATYGIRDGDQQKKSRVEHVPNLEKRVV